MHRSICVQYGNHDHIWYAQKRWDMSTLTVNKRERAYDLRSSTIASDNNIFDEKKITMSPSTTVKRETTTERHWPAAARPISELRQPINQPISQSINQPINQPIHQPIHQPIKQSIKQSTNQSTNQTINQSANQSTNQATNQPISQSTNQSIIQPIDNQSYQSPNHQINHQTDHSIIKQSASHPIIKPINWFHGTAISKYYDARKHQRQ